MVSLDRQYLWEDAKLAEFGDSRRVVHTGWSRKIETVKFGCIRSGGWIGFKIFAFEIRLIILQ